MPIITQHPSQAVGRVALYARVSTDDPKLQGENFSIDAQLNEMREFATQRGWKVIAEFVDVGVSGTTIDRPGLNALKAAASGGAFDILLVHELSRLSRSSVYDTFAILEYLGACHIGFTSLKEPQFDLSSANGRFVLSILAAVNQYYVDILKMHTKKGKHQRVRDGLYNASITPYGYEHSGDSRTPPVIVPQEAKAIQLIFERYASGRFSYQDLADLLNSQGYATHAGNNFSKDTIADMIRNRFYTGKVVYKEGSHSQTAGQIYEGRHEPIITDGLWEACHKIRARHHSASRSFQPQVRAYMLGQIAHCHQCNRRLRAQFSSGRQYYREMSNARGFDDCPNARIGTRAAPLHTQMSAIVKQLTLPQDWQTELSNMIGEDDDVVTLRDQNARLVAQRRRLIQDRNRGIYDDDEDLFYREIERVRRELTLIPTVAELAQLEMAAQHLVSLQEIWDDAEAKDQRDLMQLMLRRCRIDVAQSRLVSLTPTAPFIPLFRAIPLLHERELGEFVPIWPSEMAETLPYTQLQPLITLPEQPTHLPFLSQWPWEEPPKRRISPTLSSALKIRGQVGMEQAGHAVAVPHPGVPTQKLDSRKWPDVTLDILSLEDALAQPETSLAYLDTPFALQTHPEREKIASQIFALLEQQATWHWVDIMPEAMPSHWLFSYFPAAWTLSQQLYWNTPTLFKNLRQAEFHTKAREHTFYQAVSLETAINIAAQRPNLLKLLSDADYHQGCAALSEDASAQGKDALLGSEFTLVEVTAIKGQLPKRRKRKKAA